MSGLICRYIDCRSGKINVTDIGLEVVSNCVRKKNIGNLLQRIQHKSTSALLALITVALHLKFVSLHVRLSSAVSLLYKIIVLDDLQTAAQFLGISTPS